MGDHDEAKIPMEEVTQVRAGEGVLTVLLDGMDQLPSELFTRSDACFNSADSAPFCTVQESIEVPINAFLYQVKGHNVLIDAGGAGLGPHLGALQSSLAAMGVTPDQIDVLICTHLHPDHIGGLLHEGSRVFNNALLYVHHEEIAYWRDQSIRNNAASDFIAVVDGACAVLDAYANQINGFSDGETIVPGAMVVHLPGHTPGHSGLRFQGSGDDLLIWADVVHASNLQLSFPETSILFDSDAIQAIATRHRVLDQVADKDTRIAGGHLPGIGHIRRLSRGYAFHSLLAI